MMLILVNSMIYKEDKIFVDRYRLTKKDDESFKNLIENIFKDEISSSFFVKCYKKPLCIENECHKNCLIYSNMYGGKVIKGYYFITNLDTSSCIAIKHSIYMNTYGEFIDITPFSDNRKYNLFLENDKINYKHLEFNNIQIQSLGFNI